MSSQADVINSLIEQGKMTLALQVFDSLDPREDRRGIIENLIDGFLKENQYGCDKNILRLKDLIEKRLSPDEAHIILTPYLDTANTTHRRYYINLDFRVLSSASKEDVVQFMEMVLKNGGQSCQWDFSAMVFEILKTKI
jgi:hypothetical protein